MAIELIVGDCLRESRYELTVPAAAQRRGLRQSWMKRIDPVFLDGNLSLKVRTPFVWLVNLSHDLRDLQAYPFGLST
jgi:hypothetical protein